MKTNSSRRRVLVTCTLFALVATGVCVGLNLPSTDSQVLRIQLGSHAGPMESNLYGERSSMRRSGWPWNYAIEMVPDGEPERVTLLFDSVPNLIGDIFVGLIIVVLVTAYTWKRDRSVRSSQRPHRVRFQYDTCSALICFLIPTGVYLLSNRTAKRHVEVARELSRFGQCTLVAELPGWLAPSVPPPLHDAFLRLHSVEVVSPPKDRLDASLEMPSLRGLRILQSDLQRSDLARLKHLPELTEIVLERCRLDFETVRTLSDHAVLRTLALRYVALGPAELVELNRLRKLERVDLSFSELTLADFKQTGWAGSVRSLRLPSPVHQRDDRLEIQDWMQLRDLALQVDRNHISESTIELHLTTCPSLKSLYLSASQRYSLQATELPALEEITEPIEAYSTREWDSSVSLLPRWKSLRLNQVSQLRRLACDADELVSLELLAARRLREIAIGKSMDAPIHLPVREATEYGKSQEWIRALSRLPHLRSLAIDSVRLDADHLSTIAGLPALKHLTLTNAGLTNEMLEPIAGLQSLDELNLQPCRIDGQRFEQLLALKQLRKLTADLSGLEHFRVVNHTRIREINTLPMRNLKSVQLSNLPMFASPVVVQESVDRLSIINVPRLSELTIECPWPKEYQLKKVDSLARFAAGGPEVDDRLMQKILKCASLDQLVLAYASVSPGMLARIGEIKNLTALEVPGGDVDDAITSEWSELKRLRRVCLDDTRVSDRTCAWLRSLESLRSLSLQSVPLNRLSCEHIASLPLLSELELAGTSFPPSLLANLINKGGLELLDISGHQINEELREAIRNAGGLRAVTLLNCKLDAKQLERMMDVNPRLRLIHDADATTLELLPESILERIFPSVDHFSRSNPFPHTHRVLMLTSSVLDNGVTRMPIVRPFAVELFRPDGCPTWAVQSM